MLSPDSDRGILLKAMAEYQDQQWAKTGDRSFPTSVANDWKFHEDRTGLSREKIRDLLPQLVADRLAEGFARELGKGLPSGFRVDDGYAWISALGRRQISEWEQPSLPLPIQIAGLNPEAQRQLQDLIAEAAKQASASGITREDIDRLEEILQDIADNTEAGRVEKAADLAQLFQSNAQFAVFLHAYAWPMLRSIVGG